MSLKYHPDKNQDIGSEMKFKHVAEAYDVLSDRKYKITTSLRLCVFFVLYFWRSKILLFLQQKPELFIINLVKKVLKEECLTKVCCIKKSYSLL